MSSFNINGPSQNKPVVNSSQNLSKDGGGGNTGFMNMRGGKKKKSKDEEDKSVFLEEEIHDTFEKQSKKDNDKKTNKFLNAISGFIKNKNAKSDDKDSFEIKKDDKNDEAEEDFSSYNVTLNKLQDPLEDDEYEVADNDDYYNDIDV